jgi:hypothetical protein
MRPWTAVASVAGTFVVAATMVTGPLTLGVSGPSFTIAGEPRFLLFVSYFDALRRVCAEAAGDCRGREGDIDSDLAWFKRHGIDGIRILPNWYHYASGDKANDDALFTARSAGAGPARIRPHKWRVLQYVLDRAAAQGLLVDLTFTSDTIAGLSPEDYRAQIGEVTQALAGRAPHVLFDINNEFPRWTTREEMQRILAGHIRPFDPARLVTASSDSGSVSAAKAGEDAAFIGAGDARFVAAYHDPRDREQWFQEGTVRRVVGDLRQAVGPGRPIYLQEPMPFSRFCDSCPGVFDATPGRARAAARAAEAAGAAAWTFHTRSSFDLATRRYLDIVASGSPERTALEALRATTAPESR